MPGARSRGTRKVLWLLPPACFATDRDVAIFSAGSALNYQTLTEIDPVPWPRVGSSCEPNDLRIAPEQASGFRPARGSRFYGANQHRNAATAKVVVYCSSRSNTATLRT